MSLIIVFQNVLTRLFIRIVGISEHYKIIESLILQVVPFMGDIHMLQRSNHLTCRFSLLEASPSPRLLWDILVHE